MKNTFFIIFTIISILNTGFSNANEIYSCKLVATSFVSSEKNYGSSLYGDSEIATNWLSRQKTEVLVLEDNKKLAFRGEDYLY